MPRAAGLSAFFAEPPESTISITTPAAAPTPPITKPAVEMLPLVFEAEMSGFADGVRWGVAAAVADGTRQLVFVDPSFELWPLDLGDYATEAAVLELDNRIEAARAEKAAAKTAAAPASGATYFPGLRKVRTIDLVLRRYSLFLFRCKHQKSPGRSASHGRLLRTRHTRRRRSQ